MNLVREKREGRQLTQAVLAERVNFSRQELSSIERGRYYPSLKTAFALARELGCRIEDLFKEHG